MRATRATQGTKRNHRGSKGGNQESLEAPVGAQRTNQETKSSEWGPNGSQKIAPRGANRSLEVMQGYREGHTRATRDAQTENVRFPNGNTGVQRGT